MFTSEHYTITIIRANQPTQYSLILEQKLFLILNMLTRLCMLMNINIKKHNKSATIMNKVYQNEPSKESISSL